MSVFSISMLILIVPSNSYAVSVNCGNMIGGTAQANMGTTVNAGAITLISQTDGSQTLIGDPTTTGSLPGLDFDGTGMLWGINNDPVNGPGQPPVSYLVKINPNTGALISSVPIVDAIGAPVIVQDLGAQPGSNVLFATTHLFDQPFGPGTLVTINSAGVASSVGSLPSVQAIAALDFAPDGTLYVMDGTGLLRTINPNDGSQITSVGSNPIKSPTGLGVRGDGTIFITGGIGASSLQINTINPANGVVSLIGTGAPDHIVDLTFVICSKVVSGEFSSIDQTALMLAGLQSSAMWMLPLLAGTVAVGAFYIKTKMNKE